jgi:hypothetical protein
MGMLFVLWTRDGERWGGAVDGEAERAAELELTSAAGNNTRVRENKIGWVNELQGVTVVL